MVRVKRGSAARRKRKKVFKRAKGFRGSLRKLYRVAAKVSVIRAQKYATRDRRAKKRDFRALWITRLNAACRQAGISYSKFINGLKKAKIKLDRKVLSQIAIFDPKGFKKIVDTVKK